MGLVSDGLGAFFRVTVASGLKTSFLAHNRPLCTGKDGYFPPFSTDLSLASSFFRKDRSALSKKSTIK
jgi:hypothetical protein